MNCLGRILGILRDHIADGKIMQQVQVCSVNQAQEPKAQMFKLCVQAI